MVYVFFVGEVYFIVDIVLYVYMYLVEEGGFNFLDYFVVWDWLDRVVV